MSGGYFDCNQFKISEIEEKLKAVIQAQESDAGDDIQRYSSRTLEKFKIGLEKLQEARIYAHRIDYLLESDDSEESFHQNLIEDLVDMQMAKFESKK